MDINSIREAVTFSPENLPLRILLAEALISEARWKEAEVELKFVLERNSKHQSANQALARVYF
ncbi:MAG TPA: cell division protein, partial [Cytophagales bacterium]|nr:cell division protein [Cytophagales bacterium]